MKVEDLKIGRWYKLQHWGLCVFKEKRYDSVYIFRTRDGEYRLRAEGAIEKDVREATILERFKYGVENGRR